MTEHLPYDYEELAFDLYKAADDLLDNLVSMRKYRGMTQSQLADEMGVSQSYISQIENGQKQLVSLSQTMRRKSEHVSNTKLNRQKRSPTAIASGNPSHAFSLAWTYIKKG